MAAAILPPLTGGISPSLSIDIDLKRLWRAHVTQPDWHKPEVTAFVEAGNATAAARKIAAVIAVLEYRKPEEVIERIYNVYSAAELIEEGLSQDHVLGIFETGWSDRVLSWVEHPLVLTRDPAPLLRAWARIPRPSKTEVRSHE